MAEFKAKKVLTTTAAAAVAATAVVPAATLAAEQSFPDVSESNFYYDAVTALTNAQIIDGFPDGTFKLGEQVTRAEASKMVALMLDLDLNAPAAPFDDVKQNAWYAPYINGLYQAGYIDGYSNGSFEPNGTMTRAEFAKLIVDAYNIPAVDANLPFVDVKDGVWYTDAIETLYGQDLIKGQTATTFGPSNNIKRGDFALLLSNTDYAFGDKLEKIHETVESVRAINATTVEVDFVEAVEDVKAFDFVIDGLDVENAAVKQSDNSVVVLTTSAQDGGVEYAVSSNGEELGSFEGISAVIPEEITLVEDAVQGIVGKQVTLQADIGVEEAGVPVTFNVDNTDDLGEDYVSEVLTDENGIATYSYTQYVAGAHDSVAVYPTGAASTRDVAQVVWGVDTILDITPVDDEEGNTLSNGDSKQYKVTYKDPETGEPVSGVRIDLSFLENINVNPDELNTATINGVNPSQLINGTAPVTSEVVTNSEGEATFSVSGTNTTATPVAFIDNANPVDNDKLDQRELRVSAETVTFEAEQVNYDIEITSETGQEAATGTPNGRTFKVVVKDADGKVAAGETINVAFNENLDRNINTNTSADLIVPNSDPRALDADDQISLQLDKDGEATFTVVSSSVNDYVTPVVWIDINSSDATEGNLDDGEASELAEKTYFAAAKISNGSLGVSDPANDAAKFSGLEQAVFTFTAANQSGKEISTPNGIKASYTVFNTGTKDVLVNGTTVVSPNRSTTVQVDTTSAAANSITVETDGDESGSVRVEATATTNDAAAIYLGKHSETAEFVSTTTVADTYTGTIVEINTDDKEVSFNLKDAVSYDGASFKAENGNTIDQATFEQLVLNNAIEATYTKDSNGNISFEVISGSNDGTATPDAADTTAPTVDATLFTVATDSAGGTDDTIEGAAGAVGEANATVQAYIWTDSNSDGIVDASELGTAIPLGTSTATGTVAANSIGDLTAGNYELVFTATDIAGNESAKDAAHSTTITLSN